MQLAPRCCCHARPAAPLARRAAAAKAPAAPGSAPCAGPARRQAAWQPRRCSLRPARAGEAQAATAEEAPAEEEAPESSGGSEVAAALAEAEAAVKDGTFDVAALESLIPAAVAEVEGLLGRAEAAEAALAGAQEQAAAANDSYLRLRADFENFRRRSAGEKEQLGARVKGDVIKALVPLVDSFEAAQQSVKAESEGERRIATAYQGLYKQLVEAFRGLGVEPVPGVGQPFDPEVHDAIMKEPSDDVPDGTVLQEFRRGFRLGDTLLRPGMVKVSEGAEAPAPAPPAGNEAVEVPVEGE